MIEDDVKELPRRITRQWLESLTDDELKQAYLNASGNLDASYACENRYERVRAKRTLDRILDEDERRKQRQKKEKLAA